MFFCPDYSMVQNVKSDDSSGDNTGAYSAFWRETFYDSDNNWIQIENYGPFDDYIPKNSYLCMTVSDNNSNENGNENENENSKTIEMNDCAISQNIENNEWIADIAKFTFDNELSKIRYLGGDLNNDTPMCLLISTTENDGTENEGETRMIDAKLVDCNDATLFTRVFFP